MLRISQTLELPHDVVTEAIGLLAQRGAGKTYLAAVLVEELVDAGLPVCVIDPVGVWWGLRLAADGKGDGLPVTILGGDHGDVPLESTSGAVIADFVVEERRPCVLDLSGFRKGEQIRFMQDFAERVYHAKGKNRSPLHIVVDEADAYAPQRAMPEGARLLGAMEDLVRRGRSRGIGMTMITQRAAVLNKNLLTQLGCLIVLRMTAPQDRAAIDEWVRANGTQEERDELLGSLASLPVGTAWVWSPGWLDVFAKVKVRTRRTFDSSSTPKIGAKVIEPRALAPVDIEGLRSRIASTIEKAEADDPKKLRARIVELQHAMGSRMPEVRFVEKVVERLVVPQDLEGLIENARLDLIAACGRLEAAEACIEKLQKTSESNVARPAVGLGSNGVEAASSRPASPEKATPSRGNSELGGGERKILTALAQHGALSKTKLALITGYSHKGGGFRNYLGALRSAVLIEGDGSNIEITDKGRSELGAYDPLPTGRDLLDFWKRDVGGAGAKVLDELASVHPRSLKKEAVASRTGYQPTGGGFRNALGRLRTLGLISGRGELRISEELVG